MELSAEAFAAPKELDARAFANAKDPGEEGGFVAAAKQSVGQVIKGVGQAASDYLPGVTDQNPLTAYGQSVVDANPTAVQGFGDMVDKPWTTVKEATGNALGSMGPMLGARAAGMGLTALSPLAGPLAPAVAGAGQLIANAGPIVAAALPSYSGIREAQINGDPASEADAKSKAIALLGAGTVGAIETRFGPQEWALSAMRKGGIEQVGKRFAAGTLGKNVASGAIKGAAIEGAEELVQNPIEQVASYQNPLTPQALTETAFGAAMGAIGGGVAGAGGGALGHLAQQATVAEQAEKQRLEQAAQAKQQEGLVVDANDQAVLRALALASDEQGEPPAPSLPAAPLNPLALAVPGPMNADVEDILAADQANDEIVGSTGSEPAAPRVPIVGPLSAAANVALQDGGVEAMPAPSLANAEPPAVPAVESAPPGLIPANEKAGDQTLAALPSAPDANAFSAGPAEAGADEAVGKLAGDGRISAIDQAVYDLAAEGKSAADVLTLIAGNSRQPFYRQLAKLLLKSGIAPSVTVGATFNTGDGKYAAAYDPATDSAALFEPAAAERNALHEFMHAATLAAMASNGIAAAGMRKLFAHVKADGQLNGMYGMADVDEFIAEAYTNPKFQAALKEIDAPSAAAGVKSAWHGFVRVVRKILGVKPRDENALSAAIEIGIGVMRENRQHPQRADGLRFNHGLPEEFPLNHPLDGAELASLRRAAAGLERPQQGLFLRVEADRRVVATGSKGTRIPEVFRRFANEHGLAFYAERRIPKAPGVGEGAQAANSPGGVTANSQPMPIAYRESGALYFGEGKGAAFERTDRTRFNLTEQASAQLHDLFHHDKQFNWLHKSVATQYHKATLDRGFKRVFDIGQQFLLDSSRFAMDAADAAPHLLQKLGSLADVLRKGAKRQDVQAIAGAVFNGTLENTVYSDDQLRDEFKLSDAQIDLYREFRAGINKSLDDLGVSEMARISKPILSGAVTDQAKAMSLDDAAEYLHHALLADVQDKLDLANDARDAGNDTAAANFEKAAALSEKIADDVTVKVGRIRQLKGEGYAPLMRFGEFVVDVVQDDPASGAQERIYFGMYESQREANQAARAFRLEYPAATVSQGPLDSESWRLFGGIDPSSLEIFAEAVGADTSEVFQDYLRLTLNNRSALKRLIHRQGISGFSQDTQRVLAQFVTSNGRLAARNYHFGDMKKAVMEIPKIKGDVRNEAAKLVDYLQNPMEEAAPLRGYLFMHFLGGSVASALTNMTQPITMTLPYLAQYGGPAKAGAAMSRAAVLYKSGKFDPELEQARQLAAREGITEPHEIHQLYAESMRGLGRNIAVRKGLRVWGSLFALAESFNRNLTFIAAFNLARDTGVADPFAFAQQAIEDTQGIYNKGNRPDWARGTIGATVFTFKQFSIAYVEFLARLYKTDKKAFALAMAIMFVGAGAEGWPFAEDIEDLIDSVGQFAGYATNSKRWLRHNARAVFGELGGELFRKGVSAIPGMPIDISSRLGAHNLIPGTAMFKVSEKDKSRDVFEFIGPVGGFAQSAVQGFDAARSGDVSGAIRLGAPVAMQNAAKALDMLHYGFYRDQNGRKVIDTTPGDALAKAIGFQPKGVASESNQIREMQQTIAQQRVVESEIADAWAAGIFDHDPQKVRAAMDALRQWNEKNPGTRILIVPAQISTRLKAMHSTREQRFIKAAPREMRGSVSRELQH